MRSEGIARATVGALIVVLVLFIGREPSAAPSCARPCKAEAVACRRAQCTGMRGDARRACVERCRGTGGCAAIRTAAYVVTECREDAGGILTGRQVLVIRRGNCAPVTVGELRTPAPVRDPFLALGGLCPLFGRYRAGYRSVWAGAFQRLGVSPDGSVVVFELARPLLDIGTFPLRPEEEGIYVIGADGQGLRRLGVPSRNPSGRIALDPSSPGGLAGSTFDVGYRFSPNGRMIVFTDRGPGPAGEDAIQIATLDLATSERTQVTQLSAVLDPFLGEPVTSGARFADADTIVFFTYADLDGRHPDGGYYRVRVDGTGLEAVSTAAIPGARVQPNFDIGGGGTNLLGIALPGIPVNAPGGTIREMFVLDGTRVLQVTNFRRWDTGFGGKVLDRRARRGYFTASADPVGKNPSQNCQLFSIGTFGDGLRQLTRFAEAEHSRFGCTHTEPPGCGIGPVFQDAVTRTLVFYSSCDAFGQGIYGGQVYAIRPDGRGLRQLSSTRGVVTDPSGAVTVELPGPVAYSALDGGR